MFHSLSYVPNDPIRYKFPEGLIVRKKFNQIPTDQSNLLSHLFFTAYRKCQPDDFRCGIKATDPCIPKEKKCDGYLDCRSGKDEKDCPGVSCRLDQFRCVNGQRCIDSTLKCDHKNDCGDNSDEQGCSKCLFLLTLSMLPLLLCTRSDHKSR